MVNFLLFIQKKPNQVYVVVVYKHFTGLIVIPSSQFLNVAHAAPLAYIGSFCTLHHLLFDTTVKTIKIQGSTGE